LNQEQLTYTNEQQNDSRQSDRNSLRQIVADSLNCLDSGQKQIIHLRYWEMLTQKEIARYLGITPIEVRAIIKLAHAKLRPYLANYVRERWHFSPRGVCPICTHPRRAIIERLLDEKTRSESWGEFGQKLSKTIGEKINPPRLLIVHLNHIQKH